MLREYLNKIFLNEVTAQDFHKRAITNIMQRFDLKDSDKMDDGTYGSAFHYGQNLVLKITTDSSEAVFANNLKHKKFKHIANVESVYKIKQFPEYFVIVLEKLQPIDDENFYDIFRYIKDGDMEKVQELVTDKGLLEFYIHQYNEIVKELDSLKTQGGYTDLHGGNIGVKNGNLACYDIQIYDLPQWRLGKIKSFK